MPDALAFFVLADSIPLSFINISTLQEQFVDGYERMVEQIYFREATWKGSLVDPAPQEEEQVLDADTMTELADAIIKGKIH